MLILKSVPVLHAFDSLLRDLYLSLKILHLSLRIKKPPSRVCQILFSGIVLGLQPLVRLLDAGVEQKLLDLVLGREPILKIDRYVRLILTQLFACVSEGFVLDTRLVLDAPLVHPFVALGCAGSLTLGARIWVASIIPSSHIWSSYNKSS